MRETVWNCASNASRLQRATVFLERDQGKQMQSGGSYNSRSNLKQVETLLSLDVFGLLRTKTLSSINPESLLTCCWYNSKQASLNFTRNDCIFIVQREQIEGFFFPTASPVQIRVVSQQIRFHLQTSKTSNKPPGKTSGGLNVPNQFFLLLQKRKTFSWEKTQEVFGSCISSHRSHNTLEDRHWLTGSWG